MKNDNFLQPVISVFGLAISLLSTLLPFFSKGHINDLFISKIVVLPFSFISFLLGIVIVWQIIQLNPYMQINLGKLKNRGSIYPTPWKSINSNNITWYLITIVIILGSSFFLLNLINESSRFINLFGIFQGIIYLLFFLTLVSIFSVLFSQTKQKVKWETDRDNFPQTVFETLEKNRLIKPWIEIYENRVMNSDEMVTEKIGMVGMGRRITIKTSIQKEEVIEFIVSNDGRELLKVVKKGN